LVIVKEQLEEKDWEIANVDLIIHAQQPRLEPFKGQMKRCIAELLGIDFTTVNVKAKTNEGFGDVGAGDAIAATAIVLLKKKFRRTL
jgi:2-C-methyl-D-erythritol 2,4-cyclodiphosphate synthase